ncbi:MAG TPA: M56 family metallopeptidase [Pyrinomonadaceae bacterium]|jgi:beta-lactamase regulating signal transducer with metallopeptidase domain
MISAYSELILFTVNLAVNLILFGVPVAGSIIASFRLIKNASARLRYVITVAAFLIAAFFPLVVTFSGSTGLDALIAAQQSGGVNSFAHNFAARPPVATRETAASDSEPEPEKTSVDLLNNLTAATADSFLGTVLFSLWILGAICLLFRDIVAHRRLRKARRGWQPATNSERKELAFPDDVPLYFGEESPATTGLFYPLIVLPGQFPDTLSPASKRCIVQHELAHARWRDPLVNFLLRLIRALLWISPALWLLERIVVAEREAAADYAAVVKCSVDQSDFEATALSYAATLVFLARHFNSQAPNKIGLSNGSRLERRVRLLLTHSSGISGFRISLASLVFLGGLSGLFFMPVAFQPEQIKSQAKETAVIVNQEPENLTINKNPGDLPGIKRQNKSPQADSNNKNKESGAATFISNQNESSVKAKEIVRPLKTNSRAGEQPANLNNDSVDDSADLMRQRSEADARASRRTESGFDEFNGRAESLDALRKDLDSPDRRVRQMAAGKLDSMMRRTEPVNDSNRNIDINKY